MNPIEEELYNIPQGRGFDDLSDADLRTVLNNLDRKLENLSLEEDRVLALQTGSRHSVWQVRSHVLSYAGKWYPLPTARQLILDLTHDSVDVIAFQAISLCGELRISSAVPHLTRISGWPSRFTQPGYLRKPVGIGAAITKNALLQILGAREPGRLLELEREFLFPYREYVARYQITPSHADMVFIPGGPFAMGSNGRPGLRFEYRDYIPPHTAELPDFFIDKYPVTNRQYREFLASVEQRGHFSCHPDEPTNKNHWPAHLKDPRFGRDTMPVNGIDWYDAYAFAAWKGKKLPTEDQWEKAARGTDGYEFPWGNDWRPGIVNYVETSFLKKVEALEDWEEVLRSVSKTSPAQPIWEVGGHPEADSPYGVSDMAGNVWEWTRTNFFTHEDMDPFFKGREPSEFTNRKEAFPVIRGGCWTSLPEMVTTYFRGKDLLTDLHFEIGFRCVIE